MMDARWTHEASTSGQSVDKASTKWTKRQEGQVDNGAESHMDYLEHAASRYAPYGGEREKLLRSCREAIKKLKEDK